MAIVLLIIKIIVIRVVIVHTPLSREVFWHEYAKIPRHTSQNSIAARQSGMNFGYVTVNGVNSNIGAEKIKNNMRKYRQKAWIYEV